MPETQPTVGSKNLPPTPIPSQARQAVPDQAPQTPAAAAPPAPETAASLEAILVQDVPQASIVAKPLVNPTGFAVKSKNPNLSFRWVNRAAGVPQGLRAEQMEAVGFAVAVPGVDCDVPGLKPRNNQYLNGDLILMKILRADYEGALLYNRNLANNRVNRLNLEAEGRRILRQELDAAGGAPALRRKITAFMPNQEQAEALVGADEAKK